MTSFNNQLFSKILVPRDGLEYPFRTDQKIALNNIVNKFNSKTIVIYFTFFLFFKQKIYLLHFVTLRKIDMIIEKYKRRI